MEHFARQAHTKIKEDRAKGEGRTGEKKKKKKGQQKKQNYQRAEVSSGRGCIK